MTEIEPYVELHVVPQVEQVVQPVILAQESLIVTVPQVEPMDDVIEQLNRAKINDEISTECYNRLCRIFKKLIECEIYGLISMEKKETIETNSWLSINAVNCILKFSILTVKDPKKFYENICKMIEEDDEGIFKKVSKNPTWGVYEMFRKIGLRPRFRGPQETDPGKSVMFYYKEWNFKNDEQFRNLAKKMAKRPYDYNFIKNNINILHLLEDKEGICNYLIKEKHYHIIFQNIELTEYFKNNTKFDNFFWNKNMIQSILNNVVFKKKHDCL